MEIRLRGKQVTPAQTSPDQSKLRDIQRKAQDTQELLSLGQSALGLGKSLADEKENKLANQELSKAKIWEQTEGQEIMEDARQKGIEAAEKPLSFTTLAGGKSLEADRPPSLSYRGFESESLDDRVTVPVAELNSVMEHRARQQMESAFDGTLVKATLTNIPEGMRDLSDKILFATDTHESNRLRYFDEDASQDAFDSTMAKFVLEEVKYIDGDDILSSPVNMFDKINDAMSQADLPPGIQNKVISDMEAALTNTIVKDRFGIAFRTAGSSDERKAMVNRLLDRVQLPPHEKNEIIRTFNRFQQIDKAINDDEELNPSSPTGRSELHGKHGAMYLAAYAEQFNSNLLKDGYNPDTDSFIKSGAFIRLDQQTLELLPELFGGQIPEEFKFLVEEGGAGRGGGGYGGGATGATYKPNRAVAMWGAMDEDARNTLRTEIHNLLTGEGRESVNEDDIENRFGMTNAVFDEVIKGMLGRSLTFTGGDDLNTLTRERFLNELVGSGIRIFKTDDGSSPYIGYDSKGLFRQGDDGINKALLKVTDDPNFRNMVGPEYAETSFSLRPGLNPHSGYTVIAIDENGARRTLPSSNGAAMWINEKVAENLGESEPLEVGEDEEDVVTEEDKETYAFDYPELWKTISDLRPTEELTMAMLESTGFIDDFSPEEKEVLRDELTFLGRTGDAAGAFWATLKTAEVAGGVGTNKKSRALVRALTEPISTGTGTRAVTSAARIVPLEKAFTKLGGETAEELLKSIREEAAEFVAEQTRLGNTNVRLSEMWVKQRYRDKLREAILNDKKGMRAFRSAVRNATMKSMASVVAKAGGRAAGFTLVKAGGFLKNNLKAMLKPSSIFGIVTTLIGRTVGESITQKRFGLTLEQAQRETLNRFGIDAKSLDASDAGTRLLNSAKNWFTDVDGEVSEDVLKDLVVSVSGLVLGLGGTDVAEVVSFGRGIPILLGIESAGFESGLDAVGNTRRHQTNVLTNEQTVERALSEVPRLARRFVSSEVTAIVELETTGSLLAPASLEQMAAELGLAEFGELMAQRQSDLRAAADRPRGWSGDSRLSEQLNLKPGEDFSVTTFKDPEGSMRISNGDYDKLLNALIDSSQGDGVFPVDQANEALGEMYRMLGVNPVTVFNLIKDAVGVNAPQDVDQFVSGLDLDNPLIESYVARFRQRNQGALPAISETSEKVEYVKWVAEGMPLSTTEGAEEFYPLKPNIMEALGYSSEDDAIHFTAISYDSQKRNVVTHGTFKSDVGEFVSYLEEQADQGNGIPISAGNWAQAYTDFKEHRELQQQIEDTKLLTGATTQPHRVLPEQALEILRGEFDRALAVKAQHSEGAAHGPNSAQALPYWQKEYTKMAEVQLRQVLKGSDWPARYSDTPKGPIWSIESSDPESIRTELDKKVEYLNEKIELEQGREIRGFIGGRKDRSKLVESMTNTVRVLRELRRQTFYAPTDALLDTHTRFLSTTLMSHRRFR